MIRKKPRYCFAVYLDLNNLEKQIRNLSNSKWLKCKNILTWPSIFSSYSCKNSTPDTLTHLLFSTIISFSHKFFFLHLYSFFSFYIDIVNTYTLKSDTLKLFWTVLKENHGPTVSCNIAGRKRVCLSVCNKSLFAGWTFNVRHLYVKTVVRI